jgi:hypothetical protein
VVCIFIAHLKVALRFYSYNADLTCIEIFGHTIIAINEITKNKGGYVMPAIFYIQKKIKYQAPAILQECYRELFIGKIDEERRRIISRKVDGLSEQAKRQRVPSAVMYTVKICTPNYSERGPICTGSYSGYTGLTGVAGSCHSSDYETRMIRAGSPAALLVWYNQNMMNVERLFTEGLDVETLLMRLPSVDEQGENMAELNTYIEDYCKQKDDSVLLEGDIEFLQSGLSDGASLQPLAQETLVLRPAR